MSHGLHFPVIISGSVFLAWFALRFFFVFFFPSVFALFALPNLLLQARQWPCTLMELLSPMARPRHKWSRDDGEWVFFSMVHHTVCRIRPGPPSGKSFPIRPFSRACCQWSRSMPCPCPPTKSRKIIKRSLPKRGSRHVRLAGTMPTRASPIAAFARSARIARLQMPLHHKTVPEEHTEVSLDCRP